MSISIRGLSKSFGHQQVLRDIDLDVQRGEMLALLGPSGCGKTTLLRVIAGLEGYASGTVMIDGADTGATPVRDRGVGFVFQHYALFRHMTVFENVAFGLRVRPRLARPSDRQIREKVLELLERVQLAEHGDRLPSQLSGGQRQRVALARALAINPRVLLLDEPFGALDAQVRKELRRWLRELHDALRITSVFVTHDQDEALDIADRVVLMNAGCIEQVGTPSQVWKSPSNPFVYGFLGSVNILPGTSDARGLRIGDSVLEVPAGASAPVRPGLPARAYVRPDELELSHPARGEPGLLARISRIAGVGTVAHLDLVPEARADSALPSRIEAAVAYARLNLEKWAVGDTVVVRATGGAIFAS